MESGIKRTQRDYTLAFKLSVVDQVEKGELTYKQAQQRYGIQGRSTVLVWLRKHGRQSWGPWGIIAAPYASVEKILLSTRAADPRAEERPSKSSFARPTRRLSCSRPCSMS